MPVNFNGQVWDDSAWPSSAGAGNRSYAIIGSIANLVASATTQVSFGAAGNNAAVTLVRPGRIIGLSITSNAARTTGTATASVTINGTAQTATGQTCQLNATSTVSAFIALSSPISYVAGTRIGAQCVSATWAPTTADVTITVFCEDL